MSLYTGIGAMSIIFTYLVMESFATEALSRLDDPEEIDNRWERNCNPRLDFGPIRTCCALNNCEYDLYVCQECPPFTDDGIDTNNCIQIIADDIQNCPEEEEFKDNGFYTDGLDNGNYSWIVTSSSVKCCWDVLMTNGVLREFTINETESMKWTFRYFEFGAKGICRSVGMKPPESVQTIVQSGSIDTNPSNEACYPYENEAFDNSYCGYSTDEDVCNLKIKE